MRLALIGAALLALGVSACAGTVHYNRVNGQPAGQAAFDQSQARCRMEALKIGGFSGLDRDNQQGAFMANCLYVDGWRRTD